MVDFLEEDGEVFNFLTSSPSLANEPTSAGLRLAIGIIGFSPFDSTSSIGGNSELLSVPILNYRLSSLCCSVWIFRKLSILQSGNNFAYVASIHFGFL